MNGLRHLALLYRNPGKPWTSEDLVPYLSHANGWLFDSLLFLSPQAANGRHFCADINRGTTMSGEGDFFAWCSPTPSARADEEALLLHYVEALRAMDAAIASCKDRLGGAPQNKRNAVVMIPYPHHSQSAWGELDGETLDFSVTNQNLDQATQRRLVAVRWYIDELVRRVRELELRNVHLLGVYWMYESLRYSWDVDDHWLLKELRPHLQEKGLKLVWIPFWSRFNVHQLDDYASYYFDAAFLQPNYMFYKSGKTVEQAARAARARGAGIEMEYYLQLDEPIAVGEERHTRFREYLNGGVTYGYMRKSACAWFLGMDTFATMPTHQDPAERAFHADICRFVAGEYTFVPSSAVAPQTDRLTIAIDLGGTQLRSALVDGTGRVLRRHSIPTPSSPAAIVAAMRTAALALAGEGRVSGIGISTGGRVDPERGIVLDATALLPGWRDVPLASQLRSATGLSTFVDNDGHCAALAEQSFGAGRDCSDFVTLVLGTGLGGGVILADRLLRGVANAAGELGHLSVAADGPRCSCGNRGCVELWASGSGLARLAAEAGMPMDAKALGLLARGNDPRAVAILREAGTKLGTAIAGLLHAFNPEKVVIGGAVVALGDLFLGAVQDTVTQRAMATARQSCTLVRSELQDAGLLGAAALVFAASSAT